MRWFAALALCSLCALAGAQDWAKARLANSPRHQEWVDVQHGDRKVRTFVAYPEVKDKAPVVVLIHEIFGMSDWVQSVADQLAEHGYIAVAPDLLSGIGPNGGRTDSFSDVGKVREAISTLPPDQVTADLDSVVEYAKKIPSANGKVAVAGFCWGGGQSFRYATNRADIAYAFVFYGPAPDDITRIKAPVYGFYGENDSRITSTMKGTAEAMGKAGKFFEGTVYPGAGHGFMRAGEAPDASEENKKARETAWKKWLSILANLR